MKTIKDGKVYNSTIKMLKTTSKSKLLKQLSLEASLES